ncbi:hypothetical protein Tco_0777877 [Tanacetum coccineum]
MAWSCPNCPFFVNFPLAFLSYGSGFVQFLHGDWSHIDVAGKNYEGSSKASVYAFLWNPCTLFPCIWFFPQGLLGKLLMFLLVRFCIWVNVQNVLIGLQTCSDDFMLDGAFFVKYKLLYGIYGLQSVSTWDLSIAFLFLAKGWEGFRDVS